MIPDPMMDFAKQKPDNGQLYRGAAIVAVGWLIAACCICASIWMLSAVAESLWGY